MGAELLSHNSGLLAYAQVLQMKWGVYFKLVDWVGDMISESFTAELLTEFQPTFSFHLLT